MISRPERPRRVKSEYTGTLAKPLAARVTTVFHVLDSDRGFEETLRRYHEDEDKLRALADHFGVKRGHYRALALALARRHVPGFKSEKPKGYDAKWNLLTRGVLIVEMERLIVAGNKQKGIAWAAKQLSKRDEWKRFVRANESDHGSPDPAEVLRTEYTRHRKLKFAETLRKGRLWDEHENAPDEWGAFVRDVLSNPIERFHSLPDFDPTVE